MLGTYMSKGQGLSMEETEKDLDGQGEEARDSLLPRLHLDCIQCLHFPFLICLFLLHACVCGRRAWSGSTLEGVVREQLCGVQGWDSTASALTG